MNFYSKSNKKNENEKNGIINQVINKAREEYDAKFLKIKGVFGVATGYKRVKNERINQLAIIVFVKQKKAEEVLDSTEIIPKIIEQKYRKKTYKIHTDVREFEIPKTCGLVDSELPALGGDCIGPDIINEMIFGSLGYKVKCENTGKAGFITASHLLTTKYETDRVLKPGNWTYGPVDSVHIGNLEYVRSYPVNWTPGMSVNLDAALVWIEGAHGSVSSRINNLISWDQNSITPEEITNEFYYLFIDCIKCGAISDVTYGILEFWNMSIQMKNLIDGQIYNYNNLIAIRDMYSYAGDSGGPVLAAYPTGEQTYVWKAFGLTIGFLEYLDIYGPIWYTFAHPIKSIMKRLGVEFWPHESGDGWGECQFQSNLFTSSKDKKLYNWIQTLRSELSNRFFGLSLEKCYSHLKLNGLLEYITENKDVFALSLKCIEISSNLFFDKKKKLDKNDSLIFRKMIELLKKVAKKPYFDTLDNLKILLEKLENKNLDEIELIFKNL